MPTLLTNMTYVSAQVVMRRRILNRGHHIKFTMPAPGTLQLIDYEIW